MRPFRSRLARRALALVLASALGLTVAAPVAAGARPTAALSDLLADADALEAALDALRDAAPADRRAAFAQAYAQAADDGTTAESVERLLGADTLSGVAPARIERGAAPASSVTAPTLGTATPAARPRPAAPMLAAPHADRPLAVQARDLARSARPRAP